MKVWFGVITVAVVVTALFEGNSEGAVTAQECKEVLEKLGAVSNNGLDSLQLKQLNDAQTALSACMKLGWPNDDMLRFMSTEVRVCTSMTGRLLKFVQMHQLSEQLRNEEGFVAVPLVAPEPEATNPPKPQKVASMPLSKEFRKSALLAKNAWNELLDSITRGDSKRDVQHYRDEAGKADAAAKADAQTIGDLGALHCLLEYEGEVISVQIAVVSDSISRSSDHTSSAVESAQQRGQVVDNVLSDGIYANQCH